MNYESVLGNIEKQLRQYVGNRKAIIGISGGIDSALVAALCSRVFGKQQVLGVLMPYYEEHLEDSRLVVDFLEIESKHVNIKNIVDGFDFLKPSKSTKGNIMARIRMTILYAFANQLNGFVIGTGNKTEIETGYFTKYGDGGVDIEPIGDLYKTEVYELARFLELPEQIINKKPSAGLYKGQTDECELGLSYEKLDSVLKGSYAEPGSVEIVRRLRADSEHKRQMPYVIKLRGENGKL